MNQFVFFGGKGGVGKTTVSSAFAHKCARAGQEVLLVSTDPAHSTADVFDQEFDDDPRPVEGYDSLSVMEIDPEQAVDEHLMGIKRSLGDQVSPAIVNEIDRQIELAHRTPGAHEAALFDQFIEVMRDADAFDRVVFDTSPTGGTLRLLSLPEYLGGWIDRLLEKREESVKLYERAAIGGREPRRTQVGDPIIARLQARKENFEFAGETLRTDASFYVVLNPDQLSVRETSRAVDQLREYDLNVSGLVVNRITPEPDAEETGRGARYLRDRIETETQRLREARESIDPPVVATIESRVREVKGDILESVAAELEIGSE
ncbi:ArsA family ATPase [Halovenus salina]|uniref:ArsA family ATPase n=1 Tax=Halovenus salina TaxID=1510225 RepID=A0ABD5W4M7_9EURY|nr:TRC40/GET3/ArsA family transport-energizing ATPase [Halovenus salina]